MVADTGAARRRSPVQRDVIVPRRDVTSGVDRRPRLSGSLRRRRRRHVFPPRVRALLHLPVSARRPRRRTAALSPPRSRERFRRSQRRLDSSRKPGRRLEFHAESLLDDW